MAHRRVIQNYYDDVNNLADILTKLVSSYRLLIGGADELNKIALSKKSEVKDALKRADNLGDIIDETIKVLDDAGYSYMSYCKIKTEVMNCKIQTEYIETEIDEELRLKD
ncbi:hypothetical protein K2F40_02320 [Clostridium sp. CM028]|uniref:hypothetical protein n=1 Tax=unclassified Clostridium TaxID=2614128 RepID=UPI001C0BA805|nr:MULTISPECIES: hypothetical protein [unclassified Clostridium]MBU3090794.1 hypothetical protein [Clostridium sp. CF011]MBW9144641.1 hypothetical protein [Clostridium sp. CM027]MBW9147833.1 hypothetical protein [Clostridium sp. CM028]UVE40604.1 hypothetical protein KTC92_16035 [Clostridium sp. CM027]WAG69570.1 hypothetical protein LL036_16495 [Clostridium sp. CF011]